MEQSFPLHLPETVESKERNNILSNYFVKSIQHWKG